MIQFISKLRKHKKDASSPAAATKAIEKAKAVIRSCETAIQLNVAQNYIELVHKSIGSTSNELAVMYQDQFQYLKG